MKIRYLLLPIFIISPLFGAIQSSKGENPLADLGLKFYTHQKPSQRTWFGWIDIPGSQQGVWAFVTRYKEGDNKYKYGIKYVDYNRDVSYDPNTGEPKKIKVSTSYPVMPKGLFRETNGLIINNKGIAYFWEPSQGKWLRDNKERELTYHPSDEIKKAFESEKNKQK